MRRDGKPVACGSSPCSACRVSPGGHGQPGAGVRVAPLKESCAGRRSAIACSPAGRREGSLDANRSACDRAAAVRAEDRPDILLPPTSTSASARARCGVFSFRTGPWEPRSSRAPDVYPSGVPACGRWTDRRRASRSGFLAACDDDNAQRSCCVPPDVAQVGIYAASVTLRVSDRARSDAVAAARTASASSPRWRSAAHSTTRRARRSYVIA